MQPSMHFHHFIHNHVMLIKTLKFVPTNLHASLVKNTKKHKKNIVTIDINLYTANVYMYAHVKRNT